MAESKSATICLSALAKVEFSATSWKKVRTKEITTLQVESILSAFEANLYSYNIIEVSNLLLETARYLLTKYNSEGLRTLDSIQLATCVALAERADLFLTSDKLLKSLLQKEGLPTEIA